MRKNLLRVTVSGLVKNQFVQLCSQLLGYPFKLVPLDPKQLLRRRNGGWDLIVLTKFAGHKHFAHAKRISNGRVIRIDHGTSHAVAGAIVAYFRQKGRVA